MVDEFTLSLMIFSHFLVAFVAFLAGMAYYTQPVKTDESTSPKHQTHQISHDIDWEDRAALWSILGEHIKNKTTDSEEAQKILEIVGPEGWFGRLVSAQSRNRTQ